MDLMQFIHNIFIGIIALFPVINPIGTAFVVNPYFSGLERSERKKAVFKVATYTLYLCLVTLFSGQWILELFGISVPVVRLAGGIMICKIGWEMVSGAYDNKSDFKGQITKPVDAEELNGKLFFPITFPMTAGAGTVSVLFTLSTHSIDKGFTGYILNAASLIIAVAVMCVLVFVTYLNTNTLINKIGQKNALIMNRIVAFLIFCVGLQIASNGIKELFF